MTVLRLALLGTIAASIGGGIAAPARAASSGMVKRFALVVGSNHPPRAGLSTLRYADDDAVRWTMLFRTFGAEVQLLTVLDSASQRLYGAEAPAHRSATQAEVIGAMMQIHSEIAKAHAAGLWTAFYFVYAGHGDAQDGEGYVGLDDGPLFRHDIEDRILAISGADTNHVIIDACRSYYIAYDRGAGGSRRQWLEPYFRSGTAARFPNTGFLLASSSGGATHEWEEFQAGIFSHEVRSALLGGADTNGDGRITYLELAAFVRVANKAVRNDTYRPEILARPPANGDDVLLDVRDALGGVVRFGPGLAGRHVLEDGLGIRWADVHPGPRQHLMLALPKEGWAGDALFVQALENDDEYRVIAGQDTDLAAMGPQPRRVARRGALHEAFALLFTLPFDATALTAEEHPEPPPSDLSAEMRIDRLFWTHKTKRVAATGAAVGSLSAFVTAGALAWTAAGKRTQAQDADGQSRSLTNDDIGRRNQWTAISVTAGVVCAVTAAALLVWNRRAQ